MNHLPNGTIAVGAPGSIMRAQAEELDRIRGMIDPKLVDMVPIEAFKLAYSEELTKQLEKEPEAYTWPASEIPKVVDRMVQAIYHGRFCNSNPLKRVSRRLGLNGSQKQLSAWIRLVLK